MRRAATAPGRALPASRRGARVACNPFDQLTAVVRCERQGQSACTTGTTAVRERPNPALVLARCSSQSGEMPPLRRRQRRTFRSRSVAGLGLDWCDSDKSVRAGPDEPEVRLAPYRMADLEREQRSVACLPRGLANRAGPGSEAAALERLIYVDDAVAGSATGHEGDMSSTVSLSVATRLLVARIRAITERIRRRNLCGGRRVHRASSTRKGEPDSNAQRCSNYSIWAMPSFDEVSSAAYRGARGQLPYTSAMTPLMTSQRPITAAPITAALRPRRAIQALKRSTRSFVLSGAKT